jgi:hypothetical protein
MQTLNKPTPGAASVPNDRRALGIVLHDAGEA